MNEDLRKTILEAVEGATELVDIHDYMEGSETVEDVIESLREDIDEFEATSWQITCNEDISRLISILEKLQ